MTVKRKNVTLTSFKQQIMKTLTTCCILIFVAACNNSKNSSKVNISGAYLMEYQTLSNGTQDTKYTDLAQLKIYTDSFMMFTQVNPVDSIASFAVGSYKFSDSGTVLEHDFYSSRENTFTTTPAEFNLKVTINPDGFKQVIPNITIDSQQYKLTEEYQKVGSDQKTPLDGLWKEIESYTVKGNDTVRNNRVQYKAFYAGYFCFGNSVNDRNGMKSTGVGFGTFTLAGQNQMRELDLKASSPIVVGQTFMIDYNMDGNDKYNQTIHYPDSSASHEFYQRVGK